MSRKLTLTPSAVDALVEGSINDPLTPGLSLERLPSGKKIWRYSRWVPANRTLLRRSLGAYPAHSIASARAWASELNSQIEAGMDPRDIEREEETCVPRVALAQKGSPGHVRQAGVKSAVAGAHRQAAFSVMCKV